MALKIIGVKWRRRSQPKCGYRKRINMKKANKLNGNGISVA